MWSTSASAGVSIAVQRAIDPQGGLKRCARPDSVLARRRVQRAIDPQGGLKLPLCAALEAERAAFKGPLIRKAD